MSDYLVIVESPSKAKTIEKYLGKNTKLSRLWDMFAIAKSQMGIEVRTTSPRSILPFVVKVRLKRFKISGEKAKKVYLAADPDREGEAIAWHLANTLNVDVESDCRVVFNEITKDAIKESFKHPRAINMDLVDAQQARRILDRLVGYNISPYYGRK